ncbi:MAG: hypothetical protein KY462_14585 [Actinobacteria bacterium]|nr:hypothetical protein [Actinomycetota bacterium]
MPIDFSGPSAGCCVVDELVFDGKTGPETWGAIAGGDELGTGKHDVARAFLGQTQTVAEFELVLRKFVCSQ